MILSIDYGEKYVGLAVADGKLKIALPYKVLENKSDKFLLNNLKEIISQEKVEKIIVGEPISLSGRRTGQTKVVARFIKKLKQEISPVKFIKTRMAFKRVNIPVVGFDERLTSKMAEKLPIKGKEGHAVAAAIILQNYLSWLDN